VRRCAPRLSRPAAAARPCCNARHATKEQRRAHAAGGAQVLVERYDAFLNPRVRAMLPKGVSEVEALWRTVGFRKHPLSQYSVQSPNATRAGKIMVRPERPGAAEVRGGNPARWEPCPMDTLPDGNAA